MDRWTEQIPISIRIPHGRTLAHNMSPVSVHLSR
nr:MAG TPA: hypothetical protein [Caudoviricetes sp.]